MGKTERNIILRVIFMLIERLLLAEAPEVPIDPSELPTKEIPSISNLEARNTLMATSTALAKLAGGNLDAAKEILKNANPK